MKVESLRLPEVLLITPAVHGDSRGYFFEHWTEARFAKAGIHTTFVQDNVAYSKHGVLRGLHAQHPAGQAKLVSVLEGEIEDRVVDIRVGSPTFGQSVGARLSADNHQQLFVPVGFAHGYVVCSSHAVVVYKCSALYAPQHEMIIRWDDPALAVDWPVVNPVISPKDALAPFLRDLSLDRLPAYGK